MDKQDAIDFIVENYENGLSPSEITRSLSKALAAPENVVSRFVNRTLEGRMAFMQPAPAPISTEVEQRTPEADKTFDNSQEFTDILTPAEAENLTEDASFAMQADSPAPVEDPVIEPLYPAQPLNELLESAAADVSAPNPLPTAAPLASMAPTTSANQPLDPKLEKYILDALSRDKKHSDIVLTVCEQTGLEWAEAQRIVGRISALHRKKITARRNLVVIPLSIIASIAGIALIAACLQELAIYWPALQAMNATGIEDALRALPPEVDIRDLRLLVVYLLLGIGLAVGGSIGLFRALKEMME